MKRIFIATVAVLALVAGGCARGTSDNTGGTTMTTTAAAAATAAATTTFSPTPPQGSYRAFADVAYNDLLALFWDSASNHIQPTSAGIVGSANGMTWEHATMVFAMDSYWRLTGDDSVKTLLAQEWTNFIKKIGQGRLTGNFGSPHNIAIDDAGWGAMSYMVYYRASGDTDALSYTKQLVQNVYAHHADGSTANGLFYNEDRTYKSMPMIAIMCAALDYMQTTGDTSLLADTVNVYNWIQTHMLVNGPTTVENGLAPGQPYTYDFNNQLYWMDYNVSRDGRGEYNGPDGATRSTFQVAEAGSVSSLFANMGMSVVGARLYKLTGDTKYLTQAVGTVNALMDAPFYFNGSVFVNDRDAWADGSFAGWWASEALTLPGVPDTAKARLLATADSIMQNARVIGVGYKAEWSGGNAWTNVGSVPEQIMTSSNTANMVMAAALGAQ